MLIITENVLFQVIPAQAGFRYQLKAELPVIWQSALDSRLRGNDNEIKLFRKK